MNNTKVERNTFLNQAFANGQDDKESKLGKLYWGIDFEMFTKLKMVQGKQPTIGRLIVGNKNIELTVSECKRVCETLEDAMNQYNLMVRTGRYET